MTKYCGQLTIFRPSLQNVAVNWPSSGHLYKMLRSTDHHQPISKKCCGQLTIIRPSLQNVAFNWPSSGHLYKMLRSTNHHQAISTKCCGQLTIIRPSLQNSEKVQRSASNITVIWDPINLKKFVYTYVSQ